ncbi:MAG: hypothetical protein ACUVYA_18085 [Planctomycetota bacterium]
MRARFVSSFLFVLSGFGALAAGEPRLARGPYLQALLSDSVKVLWLTDAPAAGAVRFWEADAPGAPPRVVEEGALGRRHEVRLGGLRPRTAYRYEVLAGDAVLAPSPGAPDSGEFQFRTAPPPGTGSFRAAAIGDSHQPGPGIDGVASLVERMAPTWISSSRWGISAPSAHARLAEFWPGRSPCHPLAPRARTRGHTSRGPIVSFYRSCGDLGCCHGSPVPATRPGARPGPSGHSGVDSAASESAVSFR